MRVKGNFHIMAGYQELSPSGVRLISLKAGSYATLTTKYLGMLETAGNQAYIFATNRLRENVGASQRVWDAGVTFTYEAAAAVTNCTDFKDLLEEARKGPAPHAKAMAQAPSIADGATVEIVVATSGKALFLSQTKEVAEDLVAFATHKAVKEAPGLVLRGAVVPICDDTVDAANKAVGDVHQKIEEIRNHLPAPEARFPTLPILEPCASSGLPAAQVKDLGKKKNPYSDVTISKCAASKEAAERIAKQIPPPRDGKNVNSVDIAKKIQDLEELGKDWLGIVHADGNGMGQLFLEFGKICGQNTLDGYFDAYRKFSLSLDLCGVAAFQEALEKTWQQPELEDHIPLIPLIPLVLGGDDLTVLCDGRIAVEFAATYLKAFQEQTKKGTVLGQSSIIPKILENKDACEKDDWTKLGAAAGIAITKPHYPFHRGYELAEQLLKQAKKVKSKRGVSRCALDFHVLFDGAETSLDDLRERWTLTEKHNLTARPYVLEDEGDRKDKWAKNRLWCDLTKAAEQLEDGKLPRSQQYALRTALFRGSDAANRQLGLIKHRYDKFSWEAISCDESLFFPEEEGNCICRLLDALELVDLSSGDS